MKLLKRLGIALVALLVQLGSDWWHIERTESALKTTREAQQQVVKHSFPDIGRLVNAEAQVKRYLAALEQVKEITGITHEPRAISRQALVADRGQGFVTGHCHILQVTHTRVGWSWSSGHCSLCCCCAVAARVVWIVVWMVVEH